MDALLFACSLLTLNPFVIAFVSGQIHWYLLLTLISPEVVILILFLSNQQIWGLSWPVLSIVSIIVSWRLIEGSLCGIIHFLTRPKASRISWLMITLQENFFEVSVNLIYYFLLWFFIITYPFTALAVIGYQLIYTYSIGLTRIRKAYANLRKHRIINNSIQSKLKSIDELICKIKNQTFDAAQAINIFEENGIVVFEGFDYKKDLNLLAQTLTEKFHNRQLPSSGVRGDSNTFRRRFHGILSSAEWEDFGLSNLIETLRPFLIHTVGNNASLNDFSFISSSYGCTNQSIHRDVALNGDDESITILVAPQDITEEMGPLTFSPGSHIRQDIEVPMLLADLYSTLENWHFMLSSLFLSRQPGKPISLREVATVLFVPNNRIDASLWEFIPKMIYILAVLPLWLFLYPSLGWPASSMKMTCRKGAVIVYSNKLFHFGSRNLSQKIRHMLFIGFRSRRCWVRCFDVIGLSTVFPLDKSIANVSVSNTKPHNPGQKERAEQKPQPT